MTSESHNPIARRLVLAAPVVLLAFGSRADEVQPAETEDSNKIVFVPPKSGRPADRAGAGTRSTRADGSVLVLLAPEGGGLTTLAKPPLVWRLTENITGRMESSIEDVTAGHAEAGLSLEGQFRRGWYSLDLNRSDFELDPGAIYRWEVSIELKEGAVGRQTTYIERVSVAGEPTAGDMRSAAAAGLWFDALEPMFGIDLSGRVKERFPGQLKGFLNSAGIHLE